MKQGGALLGLRRGLKLLELLAAAEEGLTFNQIKNAFDDLVPSTVSRLLKVLIDEGMIRNDHNSKCYLLAERSQKMADLICGKISLAEKMQPYLDDLSKKTGFSAAFFQYEDGKAILQAKSEQAEAFHYSGIGSFPTNQQHAMKLVCFAYEQTTSTEEMDQEKLKEIREMPVFINEHDDSPGLIRIAAPVFIIDSCKMGHFLPGTTKNHVQPGTAVLQSKTRNCTAGDGRTTEEDKKLYSRGRPYYRGRQETLQPGTAVVQSKSISHNSITNNGKFAGAMGISFYQQLKKEELEKIAKIVEATAEKACLRS